MMPKKNVTLTSQKLEAILVVILLFISMNSTCYANEANPPNISLKQIQKNYDEKNYRKTINLGQASLKKNPHAPDIRLFVGLSYYQLKQYDESILVLSPALKKYPKYHETITNSL